MCSRMSYDISESVEGSAGKVFIIPSLLAGRRFRSDGCDELGKMANDSNLTSFKVSNTLLVGAAPWVSRCA